MNKVILRKSNRERRKLRVRKKIYGTTEQPRLTVFRSLKHIYAQIIDDSKGKTLVSVQSKQIKGTRTDIAFGVGKELAKTAKGKGITEVVFDRNGYQYHGRVQRLAEGAREGGLKF